MRAPALLVAIPLLAGAAASILFVDSLPGPVVPQCAGAACLALAAAVGATLQDDRVEGAICAGLTALLTGVSLGAGDARRAYDSPLLRWYESAGPADAVTVEAVLREDASPGSFGVSLVVNVLSVEAAVAPRGSLGGARLTVGGVLAGPYLDRWRAGRTIRAPVFLRRPTTYLNPGTPDERPRLARRGIVLVGSVKSAALVEVVRNGTWLHEAAAAVRAWTRRRIARRMMPLDPRSSGITTAVLIGDRGGLAFDDERRLQQAGTYHVIAISGGNIAILAVVAFAAARVLLVPARAAAILTSLALLLYAAIAVSAASVSRAVTVAVIVLVARALDLRGSPLNALAIAAVLGVARSPVDVLDPAFVLSFGATTAILVGVPLIVPVPRREPGTPRRVLRAAGFSAATLCAATACAEAALAPIAATLFGQIPFAGFVLNLAAIPLMTVVQIGGLAVALLDSAFGTAAQWAAVAAHLAASALLESSRLVEAAPWLVRFVPAPAYWLAGAYYLAALALVVRRARVPAGAVLLACIVTLLSGPRFAARDSVPPPSMPLRIVVLDVGQGDATVVAFPGGRTLLVDAGGIAAYASTVNEADVPAGFDIGERVVARSLRALGVGDLDGIALTHGDPDHILGVPGVLRQFSMRSIWEGVPVPRHGPMRMLAAMAREAGLTWRTVQAGDVEQFGGVEVRVLHPPLPDWERQRVRNEDSVVLEIRLGQVSIVLPGDIGREGERAIVPRFEPGRLVILKAPHHGSATSSTPELLAALHPAAVVFSCGRDNRFGHPHPAVVARYRASGAAIFSTPSDGAVFVETDGRRVEMYGWTGRREAFVVRE